MFAHKALSLSGPAPPDLRPLVQGSSGLLAAGLQGVRSTCSAVSVTEAGLASPDCTSPCLSQTFTLQNWVSSASSAKHSLAPELRGPIIPEIVPYWANIFPSARVPGPALNSGVNWAFQNKGNASSRSSEARSQGRAAGRASLPQQLPAVPFQSPGAPGAPWQV